MNCVNLLNGETGAISSSEIEVIKAIAITAYGLTEGNELFVHKKASIGKYFQWNLGKPVSLSQYHMTCIIDIPGFYMIKGRTSRPIIVDYCICNIDEIVENKELTTTHKVLRLLSRKGDNQ